MIMDSMKSKMKGMLPNKSSFNCGNMEEMEIRPGGMLVQKRNAESNQNSVPIPTIKVRVKYGSSSDQISISSQASFGELKKKLAENTGVHHQDQKLIFKKKERDSKSFLDVAGVKNGSKIIMIEDITSRERRCLEILKSANIEKASKLLQQITLQVDKLNSKVISMEEACSRGEKIAELHIEELTGILMNKLVALDGISVEGELKLKKEIQERRVQKCIEILDKWKLENSRAKNRKESKIPFQEQEKSVGKMAIPMQKRQMNVTVNMPLQQQVLNHSESVVITTKWETFD